MKQKILTFLTAVATALWVLTCSIAVPLLVRPFYALHITSLQLEESTGLTREQILEAYDDVMDYCLGLREDFAAGVLPFSADGAAHFADVQKLFLLDLWVLGISTLVLLILWLVRRRTGLRLLRPAQRGPAFWGCVGLGAAFLVVGALAATDFDRAFTVFHTLFFPGKDNWIFSPATDPVILILPQEFFRNCALLILGVLLALCALLIGLDFRKRK